MFIFFSNFKEVWVRGRNIERETERGRSRVRERCRRVKRKKMKGEIRK